MPSSNSASILQGLNVIHQQPAPLTTQHDAELLSTPPYGDLSAQLDLWTTVNFAQDEPFVASPELGPDDKKFDTPISASEIHKRKRDLLASKKQYDLGQHANLQQPALELPPGAVLFPPQPSSSTGTGTPYDLPGLLTMAGNQYPTQSMNLNQLLALGAFPNPFGVPFPIHFVPTPSPAPPTPSPATEKPPAAKRAKTSTSRKASPRSRAKSTTPAGATPGDDDADEPMSPGADGPIFDVELGRHLTTAEDKRRRNTQASARFRLKKKEREHAMESKCKDLEVKVGELERECEALRRENGWLKGLVVGVTGGSGVPMNLPGGHGLPSMSTPSQAATPATGKRKRDAEDPKASS